MRHLSIIGAWTITLALLGCGEAQRPVPSAARSTLEVDRLEGITADGVDAATVTVTVRDEQGEPIADLPVRLALSGSDNILPDLALTDASGRVQLPVASRRAGQKSLSALVGVKDPLTLSGPSLTFVAGRAAQMVFETVPAQARAGELFDPAVSVRALDAFGNPAQAPNLVVELSVLGTDEVSLVGTTDALFSDGVAIFDDLRLERAGTFLLVAQAAGLEQAISPAIQVTASTAARLTFAATPDVGVAGEPLRPLVVRFEDQYGNTASDVDRAVTLTLTSNPAGGTLKGTTRVVASAGLANFTGAFIEKVGTGYVLTASADGVTSAQSPAFAVGPGQTGATTLAVSPDTATADGVEALTVTVTAEDVFGNPASDRPVTLAMTGTGNVITPATGTTNAQGVFTTQVASTRAEAKVITATVEGASPMTADVTFVHGPPSATTTHVAGTPPQAAADGVETITLTVQVLDAANNPVPSEAVSLAVSGSANNLTPTSGTTDANGVFTATLSSTTAEEKTVTATVNGFTVTGTVTFMAGEPSSTQSTVVLSSSAAPADGQTPVTVTITLRDDYGNVVPGRAVTLAATGTGVTITQPTSTDANGVATGTVTSTVVEEVALSATAQTTSGVIQLDGTWLIDFFAPLPTTSIPAVAVSGSHACGGTYNDAHNNRVATIDGRNDLYVAMRCDNAIYVVVSKDGGQSWSAPIATGLAGDTFAIEGGPGRSVYLASHGGGQVQFTRSLDAGSTWATPVTIGSASDSTNGVSIASHGAMVYVHAVDTAGHRLFVNGNYGTGPFTGSTLPASVGLGEVMVDPQTGDVWIGGMEPELTLRRSTNQGATFDAPATFGISMALADWALGGSYIYVLGQGPGVRIPLANPTTVESLVDAPNALSGPLSVTADAQGNAFVGNVAGLQPQVTRIPAGSLTADPGVLLPGNASKTWAGAVGDGVVLVVYQELDSVYVGIQVF